MLEMPLTATIRTSVLGMSLLGTLEIFLTTISQYDNDGIVGGLSNEMDAGLGRDFLWKTKTLLDSHISLKLKSIHI